MLPTQTADALGVWLELDSRCNWACRFCYNPWRFGDFEGPPTLDVASLLSDIDALSAVRRVDRCVLSGGEPLLVPESDLAVLLEGLRARSIESSLTTNGSRLTDGVLRTLVKSGLGQVQISIHSVSEDVHDFLTQRDGSHRRALAGALVAAGTEVDLWLTCVCTRSNIGELSQLVRLCAAIGAGLIVNEVTSTFHRREAGLELSPNDGAAVAALEDALGVAKANAVRVVAGSPFENFGGRSRAISQWSNDAGSGCPVQEDVRRLTLDTAGTIRTCNHSPSVIGSLRLQSAQALLEDAGHWAKEAREGSATECLYSVATVAEVKLGPRRLRSG